MPQRIGEVSKDFLVNVALPQHAATYTVISHKFVIDTVIAELNAKGLYIKEEYYRATAKGDIAVGVYKLNHTTDPELSMMFAWTNSYNKQVKFKAVVGASVTANEAFMILGDQGSWTRKHTGTADIEAKQHIVEQINLAGLYYDQLVADKNLMKNKSLNFRQKSELLGILFAEYNILSAEQANYVKSQMSKPSYFYNGGSDTLWAFYNHVTMSMQQAHPKSWLEDQRMLHYLITNEFDLLKPAEVNNVVGNTLIPVKEGNSESIQLPGQTNLLDAIAEITKDDSTLEVRLPVEPANYDFNQTVDYSQSIDPILKDQESFPGLVKTEAVLVQEESSEEDYQESVEDVVYNEQQDIDNDEGPWEEDAEESKQEDDYQTLVKTQAEATPEEKHEVLSFEEDEEEEETFSIFDEDDDDFDLNL